jgi:hypothetical protein
MRIERRGLGDEPRAWEQVSLEVTVRRVCARRDDGGRAPEAEALPEEAHDEAHDHEGGGVDAQPLDCGSRLHRAHAHVRPDRPLGHTQHRSPSIPAGCFRSTPKHRGLRHTPRRLRPFGRWLAGRSERPNRQ